LSPFTDQKPKDKKAENICQAKKQKVGSLKNKTVASGKKRRKGLKIK